MALLRQRLLLHEVVARSVGDLWIGRRIFNSFKFPQVVPIYYQETDKDK